MNNKTLKKHLYLNTLGKIFRKKVNLPPFTLKLHWEKILMVKCRLNGGVFEVLLKVLHKHREKRQASPVYSYQKYPSHQEI